MEQKSQENQLSLSEVESRADLGRFIKYPYDLYRDHPYWIPPLLIDEWNTLRKDRNPAYRYCTARFWLAERGGEIVGRIAGILNPRANERWGERRLRFGWIDMEDDPGVSDALLGIVEAWARELGMTHVCGPMGFTDMDKEGMLVEGFDELGTMPMIYNFPYYVEHMQRLGYEKEVDWLEYEIDVPDELHPRYERLKKVVFRKFGLHILPAKRARDLRPYARGIFEVLNESYRDLYGFVDLTPAQIDTYTDQYFGFIDPDFTKVVVDASSTVVGFQIAMPRLSQALQKNRGRLFPVGFAPLLRALRNPEEVVSYLIAVHPKFQRRGVDAVLLSELYRSCIERGVKKVVTCGELEHNDNVNLLTRNFPHRMHKRRRAWHKHLA